MKILAVTAAAVSLVAATTPVARAPLALRPGSAASAPRAATRSVRSFHRDGVLGTSADFKFVSASPAAADRAEAAALAEIERLRRTLSSWDSTSEISRLFATGSLAHPSAELVSVLRQYEQWNARSGHAYSARIGELSAVWQQAAKAGALPNDAALATVSASIAGPAWRIEPNGSITALTTHRADLNSLGKGFIIDRALAAVRANVPQVEGALVNIGGDVHVWGIAPTSSTWRVAVANPLNHADNAAPLTTLALTAGSVSSSGDYERGYDIGGRHYSHIIDPRTGQPASRVIQATVVASNNATANALATTLTVLSPDSGLALVRSVPGAEALIVTAAGERMRTAGFAKFETPVATATAPAVPAAIAAKLAINVTPTEPNRHAPYVAVWVTDTAGKHVRTIVFWGDKPKYLHEMSKWWALNHSDTGLIDAITRASRPAGKYSLEWDGTDQKGAPVAAGPYMFWLEAGYEDGPHSAKSVTLVCGAAEVTGAIPQASAFGGAEVSCGPAKN